MARRMPTDKQGEKQTGRLFVVSAPSGAGKTTLCQALRKQLPHLVYSVSSTTRPPRPGEQVGQDYFFITEAKFRKGIETGQWVEWARVHDHYYGTSAAFIENHIAAGRDVLLDIDVQGAAQIVRHYPNAVTIFIMAPSLRVLHQRLCARGSDSAEVIDQRMKNALSEIAHQGEYNHVVVNDDLDTAMARMVSIFRDEAG